MEDMSSALNQQHHHHFPTTTTTMNNENNSSRIPLINNPQLFSLFEQVLQKGANPSSFQIIMDLDQFQDPNHQILCQFVQYLFSTRIIPHLQPPTISNNTSSSNNNNNEPPKKKSREEENSSGSGGSSSNSTHHLHNRLRSLYQQLLRLQDTQQQQEQQQRAVNDNQTRLIQQLLNIQRQIEERRENNEWGDDDDVDDDEEEDDEEAEEYDEEEFDEEHDEFDGDEEELDESSSSIHHAHHHSHQPKKHVDTLLSATAINQWFPLIISKGQMDQYALYSQLLRESRGVCGATWKPGQIAFKCRTCEKDPTCAICQSCFLNGDHEGHNYSLIKTSSGMCDCGDPDSWDVHGFCRNHKGPEQDPTEHLPRDYHHIVQSLFTGVVRSLYHWTVLLPKMWPMNSKNYKKAYQQALILQFQTIAECSKQSPAVKRYLLYALMEKDIDNRTLLDLILERYSQLPLSIGHHFYQLFSACIADIEFKKFFAIEFTKHYKSTVMNYYLVKNRSEKSHLASITVQLFTVPPIADMLVRDHGLLDILMDCLSTICDMLLIKDPYRDRKMINVNHRKFQKQATWHFFYDLGYVLMHNSISNQLLFTPKNLSVLLKFLSCYEYCVEVRRIDSDDDSWQNSVNFEYRMMPKLFRYMTNGLNSLKNELSDAQMQSQISGTITLVMSFLKEFFLVDSVQFKSSSNPRVKQPIVDFKTVDGPISFHIPLHKILSCILVPIVQNWNFDLLSLFSLNELSDPVALQLMDHPLRTCATIAMVRNRLWPRNNMHIAEQTYYYDRAGWADYALCQDLFLEQVCACLVDTETFFTTTLDRYMHKQMFLLRVPNDMEKDVEQLMNVMELDYMHFVLTLWSDRSMSGLSQEEACRKFILHTLFKSQVAFSTLQESVPKHFRVGIDLESIVNDVADYHSPQQAHDQGYFTVKKQFWSELDPYFISYSPRQLSKIEENYRKLFHKDLINSLPAPVKPFPSMARLAGLVHSSAFHRLLFTTLYRTVTNENTAESLTIAALHSIILIMETIDYDLLDTSHQEALLTETPIVADLYDIVFPSDTNLLTNILQQFHIVSDETPRSMLSLLLNMSDRKGASKEIERLVNRALKTLCNYDERCKSVIDQHNSTVGRDTSDKEREKKKKRAQARQKKIMQAFEKKHSTIDESIFGGSISPSDDDVQQSESDKKCAFCHETISPSGFRHFAMISHICLSNTVSLVEAQNLHDEAVAAAQQTSSSSTDAPLTPSRHNVSSADYQQLKLDDDTQWWHQDSPYIGKYNELFSDINKSAGVKMNCCSHVCHFDCFDSYFKSLISSNRQYKGDRIVHLGKKEFLCPVCGRLANELCPITNHSSSTTTSSSSDKSNHQHTVMNVAALYQEQEPNLGFNWNKTSQSIADTIQSHQLLNTPGYDLDANTTSGESSSDFSLKTTLKNFFSHVSSLKFGIHHTQIDTHSRHMDPSILSNSIAYTIAAQEISQRTIDPMDPKLLTSLKLNEQEQILTLLEATRAYHLMNDDTRKTSEELLQAVYSCLFVEGSIPLVSHEAEQPSDPDSDNTASVSIVRNIRNIIASMSSSQRAQQKPEESMIPPLMSCDLFTLFVKLIILKPDLIQWSQFNELVQLFYLAHIVQSLIVIGYRYKSLSQSSNGSNSDDTSVASAMQLILKNLSGSLHLAQPDLKQISLPDMRHIGVQSLKSACLPFMRRMGLLMSILFKVPVPTVDSDYDIDLLNEQEKIVYEFDKMRKYMCLPDTLTILDQLSHVDSECSMAATKWLTQLSQSIQQSTVQQDAKLLNHLVPSYTTHPRQFHFVELPKLYQTLFLKYHNATCPDCDRKLQRPALCLITGKLIWCRNCECAYNRVDHHLGKCTSWAREHFCGVGFNLLIKSSTVLLLRESRKSVLPPFYLDQHGEADKDLVRGCALHLDQARMNSYIKHFVLSDWDQDTILLENTDGIRANEL